MRGGARVSSKEIESGGSGQATGCTAYRLLLAHHSTCVRLIGSHPAGAASERELPRLRCHPGPEILITVGAD